MENKISDERLKELTSDKAEMQAIYYRDDAALQEKYNLAYDLKQTRAALSEINNKLIPEYIEATKRDDAEIQRLTESLSALQEAGNGLFEMLSKCTSIKRKYENNVALRKWMDVRDSTPPEEGTK